MSGLTTAGFESKTLEEVIANQQSRAVAEFGDNIKTGPDEVVGHIIGIQAEGLHSVWEQLAVIYDSFNPDNAEGQMLDNVSRLVGVTREPATKATGTVTASGTAATVIPAGSIVAAPTLDDAQFVTLAEATIEGGGTVDIAIEAEEAGALTVLATEVDTIITPVSGWDSVSNAADLTPGEGVETDAALRARREESLQIIGSGTDGAIRSKVAELDDVSSAAVISNRTLVADVNGIPGKAFRTIVHPSTADGEAIAAVIFENMPAGIEPDGSTSYDVTDEQGITQVVKFTFASFLYLTVAITVTTSEADFPADGTDQIEAAIIALEVGLSPGEEIKEADLVKAILSIPGYDTYSVDTFEKKGGGSTVPDIDEVPAFQLAADVTVTKT